VSTRLASFSPRGDAARAAAAAAAGVALFVASWTLLHVRFFAGEQIIDTPVYESYGAAVVAGQVPYRDFELEYPPAALPVFVAPALAGEGDYGRAFDRLMLVCGAAAVALVALTLVAAGASRERLYGAVAFASLAPLALGSVTLTRYDLWPAALTAGALAALVLGRERFGFAALALAVAAKLYPGVILPVALVYVARRAGNRAAGAALAVFGAVLAACVLPFLVVSPDGFAASVARQAGRPLQVESLGAAALLVAREAGLYEPTVVSSHGSQNLAGALPDALATAQTALQLAAVAAVWILFARGAPTRERLLTASAAAVGAFVAFGKVLSPQFLIWLLPLVPLVGGAAGLVACVLLGAALVTTQLWFPSRYWELVALDPLTARLVLARDVVLVAVFAVLVAAAARPATVEPLSRRGRAAARSA
jgi:hypothetical protein